MSGDHKTVIKGNPSQYVKLNVGGCLHYTTIGTLTKNDTMLRAMFSGRMEVLTDSEGKEFSLEQCVNLLCTPWIEEYSILRKDLQDMKSSRAMRDQPLNERMMKGYFSSNST